MRFVLLMLLALSALPACQVDPVRLTLTEDGIATLVNATSVPIHYDGHGPTSPVFAWEIWDGKSWLPHPLEWCGEPGLEQQALRNGQVTFSVQPPPHAAGQWRLVLYVQRASGHHLLVSNPINIEQTTKKRTVE